MKKVTLGARIFLGLIFTVFGLNGFLQFIPMPPPPPSLGNYLAALAATGFFFPVLKLTEIVVGIALLAGVFVPLSLVVLAPITLQIFLTHAFLDPSGVGFSILILILHGLLVKAYWPHYAQLVKAKGEPQ